MDAKALLREARRLGQSARWMQRERGVGFLAREAVDLATASALYPFSRARFEGRTLDVLGARIPYVRHHYNRAWRNERCIELGLAHWFLGGIEDRRVLEVGNVLAHYGSVPRYRPAVHDVLDKYERSPGVINEDIVGFGAEVPYDVLLSISTLEHVGWDERPRQPEKVLMAYDAMKSLIAPDGAMLVTAPLGQNPHLDRFLHDGRFDFPVQAFLRKVSRQNDWREVTRDEVVGAEWGSPYHGTNALFVGIWPGAAGRGAPQADD